MYARVVTAQLKPAAIEQGLRTLEEQVRPNVSKQPGFQGWELLVDRKTGQMQAITRFASEAEAQAAAQGSYRERAAMLDGMLDGATTQAIFEVRP